MYKPQVPYTPQIYKNYQTRFGGYNHTASCGEGEIYDMKNIGHEEFPVLTPRLGRNTAPAFDNGRIFPAYSETEIVRPPIHDIYSFDETYVVEENPSYKGDLGLLFGIPWRIFWVKENIKDYEIKNLGNNYSVADVITPLEEDERLYKFAGINAYIATNRGAIFRRDVKGIVDSLEKLTKAQEDGTEFKKGDTYIVLDLSSFTYGREDFEANGSFDYTNYSEAMIDYYQWNGEEWDKIANKSDEAFLTNGYTAVFKDGTYQGENAEANALTVDVELHEGIQPGDGIQISGCTKQPLNNKTAVIKEISDSHLTMYFYENTFTLIDDAAVSEENVKLSRTMPEIDFMCHCNNRLFGCKGDTIYASKLGDPYNWNVFEGISTDSYSVEVGSSGDFTGCCAYDGNVLFFKEEYIYKLLNTDSSPENWRLSEVKTYGVKAGCDRSIAVADSCLFYYSPKGIMRYTGSLPVNIGEVFGQQEFVDAVGGSDEKDYYVCLTDKSGVSALYVFDTTHYLWFKHDEIKIISFAYHKGDLTALVENKKGETTVIRLGQKYAEEPIAGEWQNMESMIEFGDTMNDTTNKKFKMNIAVVAETDEQGELKFYISCDGEPYELLGEIPGNSRKQTHKFSYMPTRCDYYRLKVIGKGMWKIYAISNGYSSGSDT